METQQFATFYLDDLLFGVEVRQVQEVIRFQEMTRVPLAPPVVQGLINLRGQIVTAVDLRRRLALPQRAPDRLPMNVVVRTPEGAVSLLVDEIGDVVEVSGDAFERPPETVTGVARDLIQGVYKMKQSLLLVLDTQKSVQVAEAGRSGAGTVGIDHADDLVALATQPAGTEPPLETPDQEQTSDTEIDDAASAA
jgi:purine-binding chemotaxis protein CheW